MTREEAIEHLRNLSQSNFYPRTIMALDMAIEALQNLSKPNNGLQGSDLISRSRAIDACLIGWNKGYVEILADIKALPSADAVEVVRCKDCKSYTDAGAIPHKSCCGFCTKLGAVSYYGVDATDFCSFAERREP